MAEGSPRRSRRPRLAAVAAALLLAAMMLALGLPSLTDLSGAGLRSSPLSSSVDRTPLQAPVALGAPAVLPGYDLPSSVAPSTTVQTTLTLSLSDGAGLAQVASQGGAPWTPSEIASQFGPTPTSVSALSSYLAAYGLSVQAPAHGLVWLLTGPASDFSLAFDTHFAEYTVAGAAGASSSEALAYTAVPSLPAGLPAVALSSPSDLGNFHPLVVGPVAPPSHPIAGPATPSSTSRSSVACPNGSLTPPIVQGAYNITPVMRSGDSGQGESIGIVDAYDTAENDYRINNDLRLFSSCYGLPQRNATIAWPVEGPPGLNNSTSSGWGLEIALDTQWAHASAPNASITLVMSPNNAYGLYYGVDWLVASRAVDVISLSWGEPESGIFNFGPCSYECNATTDGTLATLEPVFEEAAAEGMDTFVASGDCGANGGTEQYSPWYPASDPHAIGVGGTVLNLTSSGAYQSETAWDGTASFCFNGGGSGGGFSVLPRPGWQRGEGFSRYTNATRGVPDVALVADDPIGIMYEGSPTYVEGTSDAAPQWAGMAALLGEARGPSAAGLPGFLGPSLYQVLRSPGYATDFHDVTTGWNGYGSGLGWSPVTGLGTPNFSALESALLSAPVDGATAPGSFLLSVQPQAGVSPLPVAIGAAAPPTGRPAASYTFYYGDTGAPYQEANATTTDSNTSSYLYPASALNNLTYPGAGAYTLYASSEDTAGNVSLSSPVEVNVGNAGPFTVDVTATAGAAGAPSQFTATASGGTAPYRYAFFFGDGTTSTNWTDDGGSITHVYGLAGAYLVTVIANDSSSPQRGGFTTFCLVVGGGTPSCPTVPKVIVDDLVPAHHVVAGGSTVAVEVRATFDGLAVPGAAVSLSAPYGAFAPSTGTSNGAGILWTNYTAPAVNRSFSYGLYANVSSSGFSTGFGEALVLVDPTGGPSLTPWVRFGQSPVVAGSSDAIVVGGLVAFRGVPASNASVAIGISGAAAGAITGTLDSSGLFATTWDAPDVSSLTAVVLSVTLSAPGFTSAPFRFVLPVVPLDHPSASVLTLGVYPSSVPSMASVLTTVSLSATPGGPPMNVPASAITSSTEPDAYVAGWAETAPGSYQGLLETPITNLRSAVITVFNVTGTVDWANGSGARLVEETPGYGPIGVAISSDPAYYAPGERGNLTVQTVAEALGGVPISQVFMLVDPDIGNPSQAHGNPYYGRTDARGNVTIAYQAPNLTTTVYVAIEAYGWGIYNYTDANFTLTVNISLPHNSTPPPLGGGHNATANSSGFATGVLLAAAALLAAAVVVASIDLPGRRRRRQLEHEPPGPSTAPVAKPAAARSPPPSEEPAPSLAAESGSDPGQAA